MIIVTVVQEARSATAATTSDSSLVARASKGKVTSDGLGLRAILIAYKGENFDGSGAMVFVTTCSTGQQLPFKYFVGRKLDAANEKFSKSKDGKTLVWSISDVPDLSAGPARLPVQFEVPLNKGGPTYCIKTWGSSLDGSVVTKPTTLVWKL